MWQMLSLRSAFTSHASEDKEANPSSYGGTETGVSSDDSSKDVALMVVGDRAQDIDPVIEARVVRKIDWFLIPAMIVGV
jgi:hypothetical protein